MSDRKRNGDDLEQRVQQASGGEPEAGIRAEKEAGDGDGSANRGAAGRGDTPDEVREQDSRAATERIERMQREGKGMGGTSTQGRTDNADEDAIAEATRGEESQ